MKHLLLVIMGCFTLLTQNTAIASSTCAEHKSKAHATSKAKASLPIIQIAACWRKDDKKIILHRNEEVNGLTKNLEALRDQKAETAHAVKEFYHLALETVRASKVNGEIKLEENKKQLLDEKKEELWNLIAERLKDYKTLRGKIKTFNNKNKSDEENVLGKLMYEAVGKSFFNWEILDFLINEKEMTLLLPDRITEEDSFKNLISLEENMIKAINRQLLFFRRALTKENPVLKYMLTQGDSEDYLLNLLKTIPEGKTCIDQLANLDTEIGEVKKALLLQQEEIDHKATSDKLRTLSKKRRELRLEYMDLVKSKKPKEYGEFFKRTNIVKTTYSNLYNLITRENPAVRELEREIQRRQLNKCLLEAQLQFFTDRENDVELPKHHHGPNCKH